MGEWKNLESPKLRMPLELREMTDPKSARRVWEVQELRSGAMFKVHLDEEALKTPDGSRARKPSAAGIEHAVCLAVEEALLAPPDKEPGVTYEISVSSAELAEAAQTAST
jgi:hypothetical protein